MCQAMRSAFSFYRRDLEAVFILRIGRIKKMVSAVKAYCPQKFILQLLHAATVYRVKTLRCSDLILREQCEALLYLAPIRRGDPLHLQLLPILPRIYKHHCQS